MKERHHVIKAQVTFDSDVTLDGENWDLERSISWVERILSGVYNLTNYKVTDAEEVYIEREE